MIDDVINFQLQARRLATPCSDCLLLELVVDDRHSHLD
jgi:hypothetical protein